jgi:RNA polymerase sigma-70 factor (ECF subfamily)
MSTTSYNLNEGNVPPAGIPRRQPLLRSSLHSGSSGCGHSEVSDDDLVDGAQCGDQQAFVELCRRHSSMVKNKILRIVRNQEDAEDALQDAVLRAYTHIPSFRRSCKFSSWLTTIGINSALMIMRKRRGRREAYQSRNSPEPETVEPQELVDRSPGPEGIYLKQEAISLVRREIEKLSPRLRSVINQYYGSECSLEEVAKAQEISFSAAKSRLPRGRVSLRSSFAKNQIFESRN